MKICDSLIAVGSVICYNVCASTMSTFGTGGKIDTLVYPTSTENVAKVSEILGNEKYIMLGNGSNTLISDEGVEDIVISLKRLQNHRIDKDGIYAEAGVNNVALAKLARDNGMKGLEFLAGIPGSVGGSISMNAGAFGSSIGDFVEYVDIAKEGKINRLERDEIQFRYRETNLGGCIITGVKFNLQKGNPIIISNNMKKYNLIRRQKQPTAPSLGSVFKRVGDMSAGYYIEKAGLSGYSIGGAEVSMEHANFIINRGNATSYDFVSLASLIEDMVYKTYGVNLVREVKYIGRGIEEI